jgi:hypothetical protein
MARSCEYLFDEAINTVRKNGGSIIVEIGSIRNRDYKKSDGHSTLAWGASGLETWSVDVDINATQLTTELTKQFPNVHCITCEGVYFLRTFPHTIDLLYLDGADPDIAGRQWAADAMTAAIPIMAERSVILIDDTDLVNNGKGELAIPCAERAGFVVTQSGRQTLLVRGLQ